ncbi:MFS transporter [Nocardia abscessus]|uniref:MFS transporter n=1 Tax=Nocardia abscessus TaxID=120957 RepID=UPI001893EDFB|nr:MFS transporter [Nocardia abscessus]MBF6340932.1 MFS transporter [Nocardia abscessus]
MGVSGGESLGRRFGWLWAAYAVSAYGSSFCFGALPLIAITVLHAGPTEVSALAASGLAVGALVAVPLGPWVEFRRKRPVMIAMDLSRFVVLASIPAAFVSGLLSFAQLLIVSVVAAAADITFRSASGAYLKTFVPPEGLLVANARFEATTWSAQVIGPPLGGAAMALFGPVVTVLADAVSYLLSAVGIGAIGDSEPRSTHHRASRIRVGEVLDGWRYILGHQGLRAMMANSVLFSGLLLAAEPPLAVLLIGQLGFAPWQYGLAFAAPCVGGLIGARAARPLATRFGHHRVLVAAATLRACWPLGLAFVGPGVPGLLLVIVVEFGLIVCIGVSNPLMATYRLHQTPADRVTRTLSAWTITAKATTAVLTASWGLLAAATSPRVAIAVSGALLLATPLLLPRHEHLAPSEREPATEPA